MKRELKKYGLSEPEFFEERDSFNVIFRNKNVVHNKIESCQQTIIEDNKLKILEYCIEAKTAMEIREFLNFKS